MKVGKSMSVYIEKGRVKKVYYKVKDISRGQDDWLMFYEKIYGIEKEIDEI